MIRGFHQLTALIFISLIGYWGVKSIIEFAGFNHPDTDQSTEEYSSEPRIRLSGVQHNNAIFAIDVAASEDILVSGSLDKTVKLWRVEDGSLISTLRPPIGDGEVGRVYAVAISPTSNLVAVGGWSSDLSENERVYLFDLNTDQLVRVLDGIDAITNHLTFSSDGRYLAAGLSKGRGIAVWDTTTWQPSLEDRSFDGEPVEWLTFDGTGRLASTSDDGYLRLYSAGPKFELLTKVKAPLGANPWALAFSPNDQLIAVGYRDAGRISLHKGLDFSFVKEAPQISTFAEKAPLVAWAMDGKSVLASFEGSGELSEFDIFKWRVHDEKDEQNWSVQDSGMVESLSGLKVLSKGRIALASRMPDLSVQSENGEPFWFHSADIYDFAAKSGDLLISDDGLHVSIKVISDFEELWIRFNLSSRSARTSSERLPELMSSVLGRNELSVQDWEDSLNPSINGIGIDLSDGEISRSVAINPVADTVILGTEWALRLLDPSASEKWYTPVSSPAYRVNVTIDGRLVVVALGDGTIRWYRMTDGRELLALFISPKVGDPWIAWTPQGYYDAAVGADNLIGWHVNQGSDKERLYYPASRYMTKYYQPNIVSRVLQLGDEDMAIEAASPSGPSEEEVAASLLPTATLIQPERALAEDYGLVYAGDKLLIKYRLTSPSGKPISALKVLFDGLPHLTISNRNYLRTATERDPHLVHTYELPFPMCEEAFCDRSISLVPISSDGDGVATPPRRIRQKPTEVFAESSGRRLFALVVNIADYYPPGKDDNDLAGTRHDARDMEQALKAQAGGYYDGVRVETLSDTDATRENILVKMDELTAEATSKDVSILFLAGHGATHHLADQGETEIAEGSFYFVTYDSSITDNQKVLSLSESDIIDYFIKNNKSTKLLFIDACHSGQVASGMLGHKLTDEANGSMVFLASEWNQLAIGDGFLNNGIFTYSVLAALSGQADKNNDQYISATELERFVSTNVRAFSNFEQRPVSFRSQGLPSDFKIAGAVKDETLLDFERTGELMGRASDAENRGNAASNFYDAVFNLKVARDLYAELGYLLALADVASELGGVEEEWGDIFFADGDTEEARKHWTEAKVHYRLALTTQIERGDGKEKEQAKSLTALGRMEWKLGNFDAAQRYFEMAIEIYEELKMEKPEDLLLALKRAQNGEEFEG